MKRKIFSLLFIVLFSFAYTSCREKTPGEKIEDGIEDVGEGIEDAVDGN
ncbi:MAG: hypothetical protein WDZ45_03945 [Flavobacteriaceae bacterium]